MKKIFILFIFLGNILYADVLPSSIPTNLRFLDVDSVLCGGSRTNATHRDYTNKYLLMNPTTDYTETSNSNSKLNMSSFTSHIINGNKYYCSNSSFNFEVNYPNQSDVIYFYDTANSQNYYVRYKGILKNETLIDFQAGYPTTIPTNLRFLDVDSVICGGSRTNATHRDYTNKYLLMNPTSNEYTPVSSNKSNMNISNFVSHNINGNTYYCSNSSFYFEVNSPDQDDSIYFTNSTDGSHAYIKYSATLKEETLIDFQSGYPTIPTNLRFLDVDSVLCSGSESNSSHIERSSKYLLMNPISTEFTPVSSNKSSMNMSNFVSHNINGNTYYCSNSSFYFEVDSPNDTDSIYFTNSIDSSYAYVKYNGQLVTDFDYTGSSDCQETPTETTLNGFEYQGLFSNFDDCQTAYNDNGDDLGFTFEITEGCNFGFCYYNFPILDDNNDNNSDTSNNDNSDSNNNDADSSNDNTDDTTDTTNDNTNSNDNTNDNTDVLNTSNDVSIVIPYIDNLETLNENLKTAIDNMSASINNRIQTVNTNNDTTNTSLSNIETSLENIEVSLNDLTANIYNNQNGNSNDDTPSEDYSEVDTDMDINPDIAADLSTFQTTLQNKISDSYNSYGDIFGFGGYGSAPQNIEFSILGKSFTIFDISILAPFIDDIRNIFLVVAYILGLLIVFKGE